MNVVGDEEEQHKLNAIVLNRLNALEELAQNVQSHADRLSTTVEDVAQSHADRLSAVEEQLAQNNQSDQNEGGGNTADRGLGELAQSTHQQSNEPNEGDENTAEDNDDKDSHDKLPEDTFTLMMIAPFRSQAWLLGFFTFAFQSALSFMIATDQLRESIGSSAFNVPFKVDPVVRVGQLFAIIYALATQTDITSSIRIMVMFWKDPHWDKIILGREDETVAPPAAGPIQSTTAEGDDEWVNNTAIPAQPEANHALPPSATTAEWMTHILFPNFLRFFQGIIVMFISFVIIVQSDNIIDLLKDFTALMVLSETDNIFFWLAATGYIGRTLQQETIEARGIVIKYEASLDLSDASEENNSRSSNNNNNNNQAILDPSSSMIPDMNNISNYRQSIMIDLSGNGGRENHNNFAASTPSSSSFVINNFCIRSLIFYSITTAMIGSWVYIVINQINGVYFNQRYPNCNQTVPGAFDLATEHFGDGKCYGGPLNTIECEFEDGDCINFNIAYPLCKGDDRIETHRVGDGDCDAVFMNADCDYDGGDCCDYIDDPAFGDGTCDKEMNTEGCGYDNGDCITYNRDFAGCPFDIVHNNAMFGDGQCNGGIISTSQCGYDNGDCNPLRIAHPDCPFDDLSNITGADDVILGDGICDSAIYTMKECGFEYGDCHQGQVGQSILIHDGVQVGSLLFFSKVLSLDGSTLALGLYNTDKDGRVSLATQGFVNVWRFNGDKKLWSRLGETIQSPSGLSNDGFGYRMSMSDSGNHLAISSTSGLNVFELNDLSGNEEWIQVGQTLKSTTTIWYSIGIISSDGSRVALIYDSTEIRIYNLETIPDGQTWMHDDDLDVIKVDEINKVYYYVELRFAPSDDSTLLFSVFDGDFVKAFRQGNPDVAWRQIGKDIGKASSSSSMAIASNGNRIGVHKHSNGTSSGSSNSGQDEVQVLDYNGTAWLPVGSPIVSSSLNVGQEFDYSIEMSDDGNLLLVGLNHPHCRVGQSNEFETDKCTKSSGALFELYTYDPENNRFLPTPLRKGVKDAKEVSDGSILRGLHFSLGNGDNGSTLLSVSNYNLVDEVVFVDVIDLDELYYTKCVVDRPDFIGDGSCYDRPPYNTEACGFDGGDCERNPVDGYPDCFVNTPSMIGDGDCYDYPPYNTEACGFDGGDCERNPVDGYPGCFVHSPWRIGDGDCYDYPPYNTEACGFDGGDCVPKPVDGYDNCFVINPDDIGDGLCDDHDGPYNTEACGFDGGDCDLYNGLTDCHVYNPYWIGDGYCDDYPPYNTEACGFDGGDCL